MTVRVFWDGLEIPGPCFAGPLRRETSVLEVRDGLVSPWLAQKAPQLSSFAPLTLERALGADRAFDAWAALVAPFPGGPPPDPPAFRKTVTLTYGAGLGAVVAFRLLAAWPASYEILDNGEAAARERLTLVCEGFERLDDGPT